jgi:transcriptional regulator of NAD metabolism
MRAQERRKEIAALLMASNEAISGGALSARLGVSRQIIVQDIAMLKAQGFDILSTHQGYVIKASPLLWREFKVRHTSAETEDELSHIVALGGTVVDVFVWHKVYGRIGANLNIFSRRDVDRFMEELRSGRSTELMHITDGYHYHTVRAESEEALDAIAAMLQKKGYLARE